MLCGDLAGQSLALSVHHEVLLEIDGISLRLAAQKAIETLPYGADDLPLDKPMIQSDNGSGNVGHEFLQVLHEHGLERYLIKPCCPEEHGVIERSFRMPRQLWTGKSRRAWQRWNEHWCG